ncbi:hypothetical protein UB47_10490 [Pseudomonas sp. 5]|nr:hypothetical protein UB47_10490 [Pseudomonas sp. 5]
MPDFIATTANFSDGSKLVISLGASEARVALAFAGWSIHSFIEFIIQCSPYFFTTMKLSVEDYICFRRFFIFMPHLFGDILPWVKSMFVAKIN